jgi:hypothetical protein
MANAFLKRTGLDIALRENRLFLTRHHDIEAAEAQRPPSGNELAQICQALTMEKETPGKLAIARALLPAINAQLLDLIEASNPNKNLKEKVKDLAKSYCSVLGGRDLAIDDVVATINTYFFDKIGEDGALKGSNIAAATLTAVFMLVPTLGKNFPILMESLRDKRYQDALMPALSICALSAMTLNPTMAALGLDKASAIAAATGNALMMAHLPEIMHHTYEWGTLKNTYFNPETHPFTCFARNHGLVDQGLHTALDFLHEFGAQAGFFALNMKNIVQTDHSVRSPAVFPMLAVLLGSFIVDTVRGDQPFAEFNANPKTLSEDLISANHNFDAREQAARLFLQQKIAATHNSDYGSLIEAHMTTPGSHAVRELQGNTFSDADEKSFLKGLIGHFCEGKKARDAIQVAIDRIYRFDHFDPASNAGGDQVLGEILRFLQAERNKDKAFLRNARGISHADHVYRNVIAHAIKCVALSELQKETSQQTS